ncbi:hypothetical protein OH77DRAFT_1398603 [Trametes cingulata]|nr:hypothetical protein OH77DRAFT_1398603 [Trametes cingulata]
MSSHGPPWHADPDPVTGFVTYLRPPTRLLTHPELERRGLVVAETLKPGYVYMTSSSVRPRFAVKILDDSTQELAIYERLLQLHLASPNHTLPCELSQSGHPLLVMPYVPSSLSIRKPRLLSDILSLFLQVVEGVEFLHRHHIAHLDICRGNVLMARPEDEEDHPHVVAGKMYIIDFDMSRQFALGPGEQPAITLPSTQQEPPDGLTHFDPYSWDVYCLGHLLEVIAEVRRRHAIPCRLPLDSGRYVQWLIGKERGCTSVCRCRPTAFTARRVLTLIFYIVLALEWCHGWLRAAALARFSRPRVLR